MRHARLPKRPENIRAVRGYFLRENCGKKRFKLPSNRRKKTTRLAEALLYTGRRAGSESRFAYSRSQGGIFEGGF